eukprot:IDg4700t1
MLSVFNRNKSVFTKAYTNWTVRGSNDTERITDFFNTRWTTGELNEDGKRALIPFFAFRFSTLEADTDLLDFNLKTAGAGVEYDDVDGTHNHIQRARGYSRKRKRAEEAEAAALAESNTIEGGNVGRCAVADDKDAIV